jgi:hypothetical protein
VPARSGDGPEEQARAAAADLQRRKRLWGERAVVGLFTSLFTDAAWYLQGDGRFPDGLPPYAHSPQYLSLFSEVLQMIRTKQQRDAANAAAAQAARQG